MFLPPGARVHVSYVHLCALTKKHLPTVQTLGFLDAAHHSQIEIQQRLARISKKLYTRLRYGIDSYTEATAIFVYHVFLTTSSLAGGL
jgi:hypothetical protein